MHFGLGYNNLYTHWPVFNKPCLSLQAGEDKWGTDESVFVKILTTRSTTQLQATFEAYKHVSGIVLLSLNPITCIDKQM